MRLALIPPYRHINSIQHTDYQLLLPQCLEVPRYARAYQKARREGHYLILDNGAAEGVEVDPIDLHTLAHKAMVNEIVIPDAMGNYVDTVEKALAAEEWVSNQFNYMAVVQGESIGECYQCVDQFAQLQYITTIGVPRHLLTSLHSEARMLIVTYIRKQYGTRFKIHLLGTNPMFMDELQGYGRAYNSFQVRGVDTSAPYNFALQGATLMEHEKQIARPDNYFEQTVENMRLAYMNITLMKDWTYGVR